jgi:hypothetical protein
MYGPDQDDGSSHRRVSRRELLAALRNAGMPVVIDGNYADFVGTGSRGRQFEIILADEDNRR